MRDADGKSSAHVGRVSSAALQAAPSSFLIEMGLSREITARRDRSCVLCRLAQDLDLGVGAEGIWCPKLPRPGNSCSVHSAGKTLGSPLSLSTPPSSLPSPQPVPWPNVPGDTSQSRTLKSHKIFRGTGLSQSHMQVASLSPNACWPLSTLCFLLWILGLVPGAAVGKAGSWALVGMGCLGLGLSGAST